MGDVMSSLDDFVSVSALQAALTFVGEYNSSMVYDIGDVAMLNGEPIVFTGVGSFESLGAFGEGDNWAEKDPKMISPTKCKCCGANLVRFKNGYICEYCNTEYV